MSQPTIQEAISELQKHLGQHRQDALDHAAAGDKRGAIYHQAKVQLLTLLLAFLRGGPVQP